MNVKHSKIIADKRNACLLVAFKNACSWLDEQHIVDVGLVNKIYSPTGGGCVTRLTSHYMDLLGIQYERTYDYLRDWGRNLQPTVHRFAKAHPTGGYLIQVSGHSLILNNGSVFDPNLWNYGIQKKVIYAYRILNTDLEPEDKTWTRNTRFIMGILDVKKAGVGFRKQSTNWILVRKFSNLVNHYHPNGLSYEEAKEKIPEMNLTSWSYFIERGIIKKKGI